MRYYMYISNAKVDMLFPQVPGAIQQKIATKFGFDLKFLQGSFGTERSSFDSLVARLEAVEQHLMAGDDVGSPGDLTPWLQGVVDSRFLDIGDGALLFLVDSTSSVLGLGGSAKHLVGATAGTPTSIAHSFLHSLTRQLTFLTEKAPQHLLSGDEEWLRRYVALGVYQKFDAWISVMNWARLHPTSPVQRIRFLAKRLVTQFAGDGTGFTLATPLFVAMAD
jgi:uncharacterized protein DUF7019